jgi:uncharacterized membrane protein
VPLAGLAALAVLTPLHQSWAVQLLIVPLLFIIPGVILLRALRIPGTTIAATPIYVPAASIVVLTGSGLAIDLIGPIAGVAEPLREVPLLSTLEILCLGLLLSTRKRAPETEIPWSKLQRPVAIAWPLVLPLIGAAGALRLNSGHSNGLALIAIVLVIVTLVAGFWRAPRHDDALLIIVIFAVSLSMMWSFSLRGDLVYGFDISNEYYSLVQTVTAGVWHVSHPNDAYGAMLSLTVFPAELHELSGVQTLLVFKAVYPVIGALFPTGVYCIARYMLTKRWAFMAAALVVMQQTFFQQLPALARQEIGTFLFTALIAVLLDGTQPRRDPGRWTFAGLLSLGLVVSHYSTSYLAIPLFGLALLYQFLLSWIRPAPRVSGVLLLSFAVCTVGALLWNGSITHSTSNVAQFKQAAGSNGINLLPNKGTNLLTTYLQGESSTTLSASQYQSYIRNYYKENYPFVKPLPAASDPQYDLQDASDTTPPVTLTSVSSGLNLSQLLVQQLSNLLAGIGALILVLRRKTHFVATPIGLLCLAGITMLVLVRISGTIAAAYNPQRAFMQLLVILSIGICYLFQRLGARHAWMRSWILAVCAASLAVYLIGTTGFSAEFLGGGTAANLANNYTDYQRFVVNTPDLAAGAWVLKEAPAGQLIQTDRYGELRLVTMAGERSGILGDITPETTDQHSWVYATRDNVVDNVVQSETGNDAANYAFPKSFLDANFNLVYTNGTSEVFHH